MNDPGILLETKLRPPRIRAEHIARPQLVALLNRMAHRRVTLISAPAGYGKTTMAVEWLQDRQQSLAWISLGEHDNDMYLFGRYMLAAIDGVYAAACDETRSQLEGSQLPPIVHLATTCVNELAQLPRNKHGASLYLVLDDYHHIREPDIHQFLTTLIEHLPHQVHIVLLTRVDPLQLPINRLRAQHQLLELRQADLRFDHAETRSLLRQSLGIHIDDDFAAILDRSLEGWVVGLGLAVMSMHTHKNPEELISSIRGKNRYVTSYLMDEVFKDQPSAIQEFLLKTSILDQFCGPLCDTVAGIDDPVCNGKEYMTWLDQANLFVVCLDDFGDWYRYHHLFKDFLLNKVHSELSSSDIARLHRRAARWFAEHRFVEESMQHAITAGDMPYAVQLVEDNSRDLLNGVERQMLERWLSRLPQDVVWQRPKLLIAKAWLLYRQGRTVEMGEILDRATTSLESPHDNALTTIEEGIVWSQLNALRSAVAFSADDFVSSFKASELVLQQDDVDPVSSGIALMFGSFAQQMLGHKKAAQSRIYRILDNPQPSGPAKTQTLIGLSFMHLAAGELHEMSLVTHRFLAHAEQSGNANAIVASHWLAGILLYEWDELEEARMHLDMAGARRFESNYLASVNSMLGLAKIYDLLGNRGEATTIFDTILAETAQLHSGLLSVVAAFRADQQWRHGNSFEALRWARSEASIHAIEPISLFDKPSLVRARILVSHGSDAELQGVARDLDQRLQKALENHFTYRVIKILAHRAMVHRRLGEQSEARELALRSIGLAQPGGFLRTFLDCGSFFHMLLQELEQPDENAEYISKLQLAFQATGEKTQEQPGDDLAQQFLTAREEEILRLIQMNLTNQEIADELVISLYTVKRHASNIYRKLNVASRRQAIRQGQKIGILSE